MTSTSPAAVASSGKMIASPIASAERSPAERARCVREQLPSQGLFAGHDWRVSPQPFKLGPKLASELESLGRVLLQFYRAVNLLYRKSFEGRQPSWVAQWLDIGKPQGLIDIQRSPSQKKSHFSSPQSLGARNRLHSQRWPPHHFPKEPPPHRWLPARLFRT